jgi:hypothetical protein
MVQQTPYFPLGGGLDLITPAIAQKPGSAIGALNYEPASNGYRRVEGYERFDGRTSPTDCPLLGAGLRDVGTGALRCGRCHHRRDVGRDRQGACRFGVAAPSGTYGAGDVGGRYVGTFGAVTGTFVKSARTCGVGGTLISSSHARATPTSAEDGTLDLAGASRRAPTTQPRATMASAWQAAATANAGADP